MQRSFSFANEKQEEGASWDFVEIVLY